MTDEQVIARLRERIAEEKAKMPKPMPLKIVMNSAMQDELSDALRENYPSGEVVCWDGETVTFVFGCNIEANNRANDGVMGLLRYDQVCTDEIIDHWNMWLLRREAVRGAWN